MKIKILFIILSFIIILSGCNVSKKQSTDTLKFTQDDEKRILEYLDTKTNNIAYSKKGKMYSAFKLLGTERNKIYMWVSKVEYFKLENTITHENGDAVSLPIVLDIEKSGNSFIITGHNIPEDGENFGKSTKSLFPSNIKFPKGSSLVCQYQWKKYI